MELFIYLYLFINALHCHIFPRIVFTTHAIFLDPLPYRTENWHFLFDTFGSIWLEWGSGLKFEVILSLLNPTQNKTMAVCFIVNKKKLKLVYRLHR